MGRSGVGRFGTAGARHYQVHEEFASPRDHLFLLEARDRSKGGVVQGSSSLCDEIE